MIKRLVSISYHFIVEIVLGLLCSFFFFISSNKLPPLLFLFLFCFIGMVLFFILLDKWNNKGKWVFYVTVFPLLLFMGNKIGLPLYISIMLGLFIYWRGIFLYEDASENSRVFLLLLSFLFGIVIIVYSAMSQYQYQNQIIYLLLFQLLLVVVGSFTHKWFAIKEGRIRFALYFLKVLTIISFIGITGSFLVKYIRFIFISIAQFLISLIVFMLNPLLNHLGILVNNHKLAHYKIGFTSDMKQEADQPWQLPFSKILFILLVLAGVGYLIYLISQLVLRKKDTDSNRSPSTKVMDLGFEHGNNSGFHRKVKPPQDSIRREIFNFEKFAAKLKYGRYTFETLEEWLQRIGLGETEQVIDIYEKNRYGGHLSSQDELLSMKSNVQLLKHQLKIIAKNKPSKS